MHFYFSYDPFVLPSLAAIPISLGILDILPGPFLVMMTEPPCVNDTDEQPASQSNLVIVPAGYE
jgi:hypothetical protein